jgi:DhnA family fructose-bisphosphate aldolase class Ia
VIFSGGAAQNDEQVLTEIQAIQEGGGFGSIIGRNSFQRPETEMSCNYSVKLLISTAKLHPRTYLSPPNVTPNTDGHAPLPR